MRRFFLLMVTLICMSAELSAKELLRVGTTLWPGYEPIHLAEEQGAFQGYNIRTIDYPSTSEVLRAFRNGTLEVAALTLDEVVSLKELGVPLRVILVCDISNGGDVIVAKQEIASIAQLKGKRVAVESTAVGAYALSRALQLNNLALTDIQIVNMGVNNNLNAFKKDSADAFVTYEPVRTQLLNMGLWQIFSSKEIPGEIVDVLIVHESFYLERRTQLKVLVEGWFGALKQLEENPASSYQYIAERMNITPKEVGLSYQGLRFPDENENRVLLDSREPKLRKVMTQLIELMLKTNLIAHELDLSNIFTSEFLPSKQ